MWAYAYVLADNAHLEELSNGKGVTSDFVQCCGPQETIALPIPDVVVGDPGQVYDRSHETSSRTPTLATGVPSLQDIRVFETRMHVHYSTTYNSDRAILAGVCLGTSGHSWFSENDSDYFVVTEGQLTNEECELLNSLEKLYGTRPSLVTYLDT